MHSNATTDEAAPFKYLPALIVTILLSSILIAATAPSASALPPNFFGLMPNHDQAHTDSELEAAARSGAKYWRIGFNCFEWYGDKENVWKNNWDEQVELAWKHGLQPLATIESRCKQASGEIPHEDEWGSWEELAKALVAHYGYLGSFWQGKENKREIEVWEIQNEPNLAEHGWEGNASGTAYAKLFKRASEAIHAAQGTFFPSRVIVGGLYYVHNDSASKTPHTFMQEMAVNYPAVVPWVDGVAIHPYEWGSSAVSATEADINGARNDINAFFGSEKTLWITEIGWNVENGAAGYNEGHSYPEVSETEQSNRLTELFNWVRGVQESKKIQALIYYSYRDFEYNQNPWWTRAGLRRGAPPDRYSKTTFRPAWYAFQSQTGTAKWPVSPGAETLAATSVTSTSATLNGAINPHGLPTGYHFDWAEGSEGFSHQIPPSAQEVGWKEGSISMSQTLTGLKPDTTYVFRVVATNENDETYAGVNFAFTTLPASPTVIVDSSGVQHVYYSNSSGQLAEWYRSGSSWQHRIWGYASTMAGDPSAIATSDGSRWVYFRATNGAMHSWWFNGSNWNENSWGYASTMAGDPSAIATSDGSRWVYFRATNGAMHSWWFNGSNWNENSWGYASTMAGDPSAIATSDGSRWVYFRATNGAMHSWWFNGSNWNENSWGYASTMAGDPSAIATSDGSRWVYFRATNGAMHSWWFNGSNWNENSWGYASTMAGDPSAIATSDGSRWVYFRATNGAMHSWWFNGSNWNENSWGYANALGDDPTAVVGPGGAREVFYFGSDGVLYRWWFLGSEWSLEPIGPR